MNSSCQPKEILMQKPMNEAAVESKCRNPKQSPHQLSAREFKSSFEVVTTANKAEDDPSPFDGGGDTSKSISMLPKARHLRLLRLRAALKIIGLPLRLASDLTFWLQGIHARLETTLANEEANDFMRATARPLRLLRLRAALKIIGLPLRLASHLTYWLQGIQARLQTALDNEEAKR